MLSVRCDLVEANSSAQGLLDTSASKNELVNLSLCKDIPRRVIQDVHNVEFQNSSVVQEIYPLGTVPSLNMHRC